MPLKIFDFLRKKDESPETREIFIDAGTFTDRVAAHDALKAAVVPAGEPYGRNLDALHDVLTSITVNTSVKITGFGYARSTLGDYAATMEKVFCDSAAENSRLQVTIED